MEPIQNGRDESSGDLEANPTRVHKHNLRDRKGRKKLEIPEGRSVPAIIPISESPDIVTTASSQLGTHHIIIRIPLIKWVGPFSEVVTTASIDQQILHLDINNKDMQQYLTINARFSVQSYESVIDVWGKVLWVSQTQLLSKLVRKGAKRIGNDKTELVRVKIADIHSDLFIVLHFEPIPPLSLQYQGLINQGNTCYMNSFLQMLYHLGQLRHIIFQISNVTSGKFPATLQSVFYHLQNDSKAVSTEQLSKSYGWTRKQALVQQDIQEFSCLFFEVLEKKINSQLDLNGKFEELFSGEIIQYVQCTDISYRSERLERFIDLQLSVNGCSSLEQSLESFTGYELLDGDNIYQTTDYGKQKAKKGLIINKLPPVLMIQLKRFEFNYETERNQKILSRYTYSEQFDFSTILKQKTPLYRLYAVLVHEGLKAQSGHYYAYLRLKNQWYKFNDERVEEATHQQVFQYNFGGQLTITQLLDKELIIKEKSIPIESTAYMLVYYDSSRQAQIFSETSIVPQWLQEEFQTKIEQEKLKKIKQEQLKCNITDWNCIKSFPVSSCGLLHQTDVKNPDRQFESVATQSLQKQEYLQNFLSCLRATRKLQENEVSFWMLTTFKERQVLFNPFRSKPNPTILETFKESAKPILLILTKKNKNFIKLSEEGCYEMVGDVQEEQQMEIEQFDSKAYKNNQLVVCFVKLYKIDHDNQTEFALDDYHYFHMSDTYGQVIDKLMEQYRQQQYQGRVLREARDAKDFQLEVDVDRDRNLLVDPSKSRLFIFIVEKISVKAQKPLSVVELFNKSASKVGVQIRSSNRAVDALVYLDKDMSISQLRKFIYEEYSSQVPLQSQNYVLIRCRDSKTNKKFIQVHEGDVEFMTRFQKVIEFDRSNLMTEERLDNSIIKIRYRHYDMSKSQKIEMKVPKIIKAEELALQLKNHEQISKRLRQQQSQRLRLLLLDNLEEKVLRVVTPQTEIEPLIRNGRSNLFVEADDAFQDSITIYCHHKTGTGQYLPNPLVFCCPKDLKCYELRQRVLNRVKDFVFSFDGKQYPINVSKIKLILGLKGQSSSRGTEIFEDSADTLEALYVNAKELSVELVHLSIKKYIQSMKLNV